MRIGESASGRITATASNWEPWLLWTVMAWTVSTDPSRRGLTSKQAAGRSKAATGATVAGVDDDAGVAVVQAQAVVVLGDEKRAADVPRPAVAVAGDRRGEPALDVRGPLGDAVGAAAVGAQDAHGAQGVERGAGVAGSGGVGDPAAGVDDGVAHGLRAPAATSPAATSTSIQRTSSSAGAEHGDRGFGVAALDRRGQLGDRAAEAVDVAEHDDAAADRRR